MKHRPCDICKRKGCKDTHQEVNKHIYFDRDGYAHLSVKGITKFGKDYLSLLRRRRRIN